MSSFHERFEISVGFEESQRRFVNRLHNEVFESFVWRNWNTSEAVRLTYRRVVSGLGERYGAGNTIVDYVGANFHRNLEAVEVLFREAGDKTVRQGELDRLVGKLVRDAEVDLGIRWERGRFFRTGAALLDEKTVNDPLRWLADPRLMAIREPFSKGLAHLLQAPKRPELYADVITDMYEALEAAAKLVTGKDRDLSANREAFVSALRLSKHYKKLLRAYIEYANDFRHAATDQRPKPSVSEPEAEGFVYFTGMVVRLAIGAGPN